MSEYDRPTIITGYRICCLNTWCSGPEKYARRDTKPTEYIPCPTCGWPAMPDDELAVRPIVEEMP